MVCFPALFVIVRDVLYELADVDHPVSDVHGPRVVDGGHDEALVEAQVVDGAVGQGQVGHLLRRQVAVLVVVTQHHRVPGRSSQKMYYVIMTCHLIFLMFFCLTEAACRPPRDLMD